MSLLNTILWSVINDQISDKISQATGLSPEQTKKAVSMAMPLLIWAMAKNSSTQEGATSLNDALDQHDGNMLDNIDISTLLNSDDGQKIIGHILGNKTEIAEQVIAKETGSDSSQIASILKIAWPILMGALSKEKKTQGFDVEWLTGLWSNEKKEIKADSGIQGMIFDFIDQNDDGSIIDDLFTFANKMMKK